MRYAFWLIFLTLGGCKGRSDSNPQDVPLTPLVSFEDEPPYNKNLDSKFANSGFNFAPLPNKLKISSVISGEINLLSRFGTPTVLKSKFLKDELFAFGFFHEALDIARKNLSQPDTVYAPVSGEARLVYDINPKAESDEKLSGYETSLVIHDKESHYLVALLHLEPQKKFKDSQGFIFVKRGDPIGVLANLNTEAITDKPELRHIHLMVIDYQSRNFINPSRSLQNYKDMLPPKIMAVAFYDTQTRRSNNFPRDNFDIVVSAYDQDNFSGYNQELFAIKASVRDENGRSLFELPRCNLEDLWFRSTCAPSTPV